MIVTQRNIDALNSNPSQAGVDIIKVCHRSGVHALCDVLQLVSI
jgi:hypothetical protein